MFLLQILVTLLQGLVFLEQGLAVHRPLKLRILEFIQLLLLLGELSFNDRQLLLPLLELPAGVLLQRPQMRNEFLVLLQDVGERLGFWRLGRHQAAFRRCCR